MIDEPNRIDVNTATLEELQNIPGISTSMAEKIAAARPFSSIEDMKRVSGIGDATLERLRSNIFISQTEGGDDTPKAAEAEDALDTPLHPPEQLEKPREEDQAENEEPAEATPELQAAPEVDPVEALPAGEPLEEIEARELPGEEEKPVTAAPAGEVKDTPAEQPVRPAVEKAPPPLPAARRKPEGYTRAQALWLTLGASFLTFLVSVAAILGMLLILNGSLRYTRPDEFSSLKRQVAGLEAQTTILEQDLDGLRGRLENLEALSGRISTLENELKKMRGEVSSATSKIAEVEGQIGEFNTQIEELRANSNRFQSFLDGLRSLLGELATP